VAGAKWGPHPAIVTWHFVYSGPLPDPHILRRRGATFLRLIFLAAGGAGHQAPGLPVIRCIFPGRPASQAQRKGCRCCRGCFSGILALYDPSSHEDSAHKKAVGKFQTFQRQCPISVHRPSWRYHQRKLATHCGRVIIGGREGSGEEGIRNVTCGKRAAAKDTCGTHAPAGVHNSYPFEGKFR